MAFIISLRLTIPCALIPLALVLGVAAAGLAVRHSPVAPPGVGYARGTLQPPALALRAFLHRRPRRLPDGLGAQGLPAQGIVAVRYPGLVAILDDGQPRPAES